MVLTYQGKRQLLDEIQRRQPPGGLVAFPPFIYLVTRSDRQTAWHVQARPSPPEAGLPKVMK